MKMMNKPRAKICDRVKKHLEFRGQSMHWLAEKLNISDGCLCYRFRTDSFKPYELETIAKLFKLKNPWEFYFGDDED